MRGFSTFIGSAICGALVFAIWPEMWKSYGIMGGWLAATILISICWYMNHWLGIIDNPQGKIWVDQGWAVLAAGVAWALVRFPETSWSSAGDKFQQFLKCLPTVLCCFIGGGLAGIAAAYVKKHNPRFNPPPAKKETPELEEVGSK